MNEFYNWIIIIKVIHNFILHMNHLETQYIRFPTITKLFYDGDGKSKPKDIFRTTRAKLTTNRQFYTNPSSHD